MNNIELQTISEYIQEQFDNLEKAEQIIKNQIIEIGSRKAAELTEINQGVLSSYAHNNRKFSLKRTLFIAEKIF